MDWDVDGVDVEVLAMPPPSGAASILSVGCVADAITFDDDKL